MSPYTIVSRKFTHVLVKIAAWKSAKTVGKDSGCESGGLHVSMDRKTTVYGLEASIITFFQKRVQAGHNNAFPYFTGLL